MIDYVIKYFDCYKEDIFYFGDSKTDIETCRVNNINCTCVSWGFENVETLSEYKDIKIIDTPEDILKVIKHKK